MPAGTPNTFDWGPIANIGTMEDLRRWLTSTMEKLRFTIEHMTSDIVVNSEGFIVSIGPTETDGSWRLRGDGTDLFQEVRISGSWVEKAHYKQVRDR